MLFSMPFLCLTLSGVGPARAEEQAGVIRTVAGPAFVVRDGRETPALPGGRVDAGDTLRTGEGGSLGVILRDDALLSLGPQSTLVIATFLFEPAQKKLGLVARIVRGTVGYLSGIIARLAPETVRLETPVASIGVRGTRLAVKVDG
jgi:hypothetical protein